MKECERILELLSGDDFAEMREGAFLAGEKMCTQAVIPLTKLLCMENLGVQEAADRALRMIGGSETVEALVPLMKSDSAPVRNLAMDILRSIGGQHLSAIIAILKSDDADLRIFASDILGSAGDVLVVPHLCESMLKDPEVNVRYQAAVSLGELGRPEASDCLNKALGDEEWVQYAAIEALAKIKSTSSVSALIKAMDRSSDLVNSMIIDALGETGNAQAAAMLLKRMDDSPTVLNNKIVRAVVSILGGEFLSLLSPEERINLNKYMLLALDDEDVDVQDAAMLGLTHIGSEKAASKILYLAAGLVRERDQDRLDHIENALTGIGLTKALGEGLENEDPVIVEMAARVLSLVGGDEAARALMHAFPGKHLHVQRDIAWSLAQIGSDKSVDFFMNMLDTHEDGDVLKAAMHCLGKLLKLSLAGDKIFTFIGHKYNDVKNAALEASIAINGPEMTARFKSLAVHEDPVKRTMGVYALSKIGARENMEILHRSVEDDYPDVRKVAVEALAEVCEENEAMRIVTSRLDDENREVRLTVVGILGECAHPESVEYLIRALDDPDDWVKARAVEYLGGREEAVALERIVSLLDSDNKILALKAMDALATIGGTVAFRALMGMLDNEDQELSDTAESALARLTGGSSGEEVL